MPGVAQGRPGAMSLQGERRDDDGALGVSVAGGIVCYGKEPVLKNSANSRCRKSPTSCRETSPAS